MARSLRRKKEWDWESAKYADLSHPEWLDERVPLGFWNDSKNHRRYIVWLGQKLKIQKLDDWYQTSSADFRKNRGQGVLARYGGSHIYCLQSMFPSHDWKPWLFKITPQGFWLNKENRIWYLQWLEEQLGIQGPDDWYSVCLADFVAHRGISLVDGKNRGMIPAIKELYPDHDWQEWRFNLVPIGFWQNRENRLRYLNWLKKKLGIQKPDDWYRVGYDQIANLCGSSILTLLGSWPAVVQDAFPDETWIPWRFTTKLDRYWRVKANRIAYMNWLGEQLGYQDMEDWYGISLNDFRQHHGNSLIKFYGCSPFAAVRDCFSNYDWQPWKFTSAPDGFWARKSNRIVYMNWLGKQLGFQKPEDWYSIRAQSYTENFGSTLLQYCGAKPSRPVIECFPEYSWLPWKFHKTPSGFWNLRQNRVRYMNWLGKQLGFRCKEELYKLKPVHFFENHGQTLFVRYYQRSVLKALQDYRPHYNWRSDVFIK